MTTTYTPLNTKDQFLKTIRMIENFRDNEEDPIDLCAPRISFIHDRPSGSFEPRILFYGQVPQLHDLNDELSYEQEIEDSYEHAKWHFDNATKSSFWRGIKAIIADLLGTDTRDPSLFRHIGWSNVMKISLHEGNPRGKQYDKFVNLQKELACEQIRHELLVAGKGKFDAVVFMTNTFCWDEYLSDIFPNFPKQSDGNIVRAQKDTVCGPVLLTRHPRNGLFWQHKDELVQQLRDIIGPQKVAA